MVSCIWQSMLLCMSLNALRLFNCKRSMCEIDNGVYLLDSMVLRASRILSYAVLLSGAISLVLPIVDLFFGAFFRSVGVNFNGGTIFIEFEITFFFGVCFKCGKPKLTS